METLKIHEKNVYCHKAMHVFQNYPAPKLIIL